MVQIFLSIKKTNFDHFHHYIRTMNIGKLGMLFTGASCVAGLLACQSPGGSSDTAATGQEIKIDQFADLEILRYDVPGWDALSLDQKKLAYYLYQAGLSGRDIIYDQR